MITLIFDPKDSCKKIGIKNYCDEAGPDESTVVQAKSYLKGRQNVLV